MTATPFSYINNAFDDLNEVCLHITYLFLKELVFVSDVFLLALLFHENLHSLPEVVRVSRVFSPESTPLVIQQVSSPLLSSFIHSCLFFYLFIYFIVIANIFFFSNRSLGTFFHGFRIPDSVSGFHVLVLPSYQTFQPLTMQIWSV